MFKQFDAARMRGLEAVRSALQTLETSGEPLTTQDSCRLFALAIEHGAPIWNEGDRKGCAEIYLCASQGLLAQLNYALNTGNVLPEDSLVEFIRARLRPVASPDVPVPTSEEDAVRLAWQLRDTFDLILAVWQALQQVRMFIENVPQRIRLERRALTPEEICGIIGLAIEHGVPIWNAGGRKACADIYLRTARMLLACIPQNADPLSRLAHSELSAAARTRTTVPVEEEQAMELAWDLRFAFDRILAEAEKAIEVTEDREIEQTVEELGRGNFQHWAGGAEVATVAIVFTDIVGSSRLNLEMGNAPWLKIVDQHFLRGEQLIAKGRGMLIKTIGDSMMSVFRSSDAALDFALALAQNTGHPAVKIRAGIHIGVVSIAPNDVRGHSVNMAARVEGCAKEGGIWVSEAVKKDIEMLQMQKHAHLKWTCHPNQTPRGVTKDGETCTFWSVEC